MEEHEARGQSRTQLTPKAREQNDKRRGCTWRRNVSMDDVFLGDESLVLVMCGDKAEEC